MLNGQNHFITIPFYDSIFFVIPFLNKRGILAVSKISENLPINMTGTTEKNQN